MQKDWDAPRSVRRPVTVAALGVKAGLKQVGVDEVGFYQKRGLFAEYAKANAVG